MKDYLSQKQKRRRLAWVALIGLSLVIGILLAWLSLAKYWGYNLRSFDLGNMSQAIWSVTQGQPLVFTTEGIAWSRLSLHVELIYFLFAPLYALWSSPELLLILQAGLYALGAWPLFRFARRRLDHQGAALGLAAVYLLYPVGQTAVLFHFHGDTIAVPFLLFAIDALDRNSQRAYGIWLVLALSCKFYVAAPVAVMGGVLWLQGEKRVGLATLLLAVGWGTVAFFGIRPLFAPPETVQTAATTGGYLEHYFGSILSVGQTAPVRLINGIIVFAPVLLLSIRAPLWLLPAVAVVFPVMLSNGPGPSYDYRYHHYALAVPFLMAAAVYGAARLRRRALASQPPEKWIGYIRLTVGLTLVLNALLVNTPLNPFFYQTGQGSGLGMGDSSYGVIDRDAFKTQWLAAHVPPDASVSASDQLGFRLVNRPVFYRTRLKFKEFVEILPGVDYVVLDALHDFVRGTEEEIQEGGIAVHHDNIGRLLQHPDFVLLKSQDGLLLFGRKGLREGEPLRQTIQIDSQAQPGSAVTEFDDLIALHEVMVTPQGGRRYLLSFTWSARQSLESRPKLVAVTHLPGLDHMRVVHLPTSALLPTSTWKGDQLITESFEIELPDSVPSGRYQLQTAWYDAGDLLAAKTDERSRVGPVYAGEWLEVP